MPDQPVQFVNPSPPPGLQFVHDLDRVRPEIRSALLRGREILSQRAVRNREF